jgi:cytochrome c
MKPSHLIAGLLLALTLPALAQEDAAARRLALNHFGEGEAARQGPNLHGITQRPAGSAEGFAYSEGFRKALAGRKWDAALLDLWLADPQAVAPGTVMLYRQDDADQRAQLVRFVESLQ